MKFLDALLPRSEAARYQPPAWMDTYLPGGAPYMPGYTTSYGHERAEPIGDTFVDYVIGGLQANSVVAAIERVRLSLFSEARFQFQQMRNGRPGDLFGTADLAILERPWDGGTTGDMLTRMLLDADFAGAFFGAEIDGELTRMRPDWVEIVLTERWNADAIQVGWRRLGYAYYEGGKNGQVPAVFLPDEVVHFSPLPDPLATWRGMSWLTPVVREVMADGMATKHKLKFFENAATPNLAVSLPREVTPALFDQFVDAMDAKHKGADQAYKTLYTGGGADVTVIGADMKQLDFKVTQGAGETRIAAAGGIHPVIVGLSEGLSGSSLNAGNFGAARRLVADGTMRPLWRNAAGSLEVLVPPPGTPGTTRLWYDDRDIAFLREDAADQASIVKENMLTVESGVRAGYEPDTVVAAVAAGDLTLMKHTGLYSVQLQPPLPGQTPGDATAPPVQTDTGSGG